MPEFSELFSRNIGTITDEQQRTLQLKKVAVIGCGGLGGHVIEQLVRLGVGNIHCFDPDFFSLSNCNRQLNATADTLGRNKAEVAAERAEKIHSYSRVTPFQVDFRSASVEDIIQTDVVIDCLDDIKARLDLAQLCGQCHLMLVHGAVSGWYGQVGVQPPGGTLLNRLYPPLAAGASRTAPSVLACTVALVASLQVAETIKILLGFSSSLTDTWLHVDLKDYELTLME